MVIQRCRDGYVLILMQCLGAARCSFAACRCGTNQTGGFVQGSSASDGLLGLGLADISVPSTMARQGVAQNSFSMCFALDGSGRILFGDRGPPKQPSTPLVKISNL
jgi:hypothetical protein